MLENPAIAFILASFGAALSFLRGRRQKDFGLALPDFLRRLIIRNNPLRQSLFWHARFILRPGRSPWLAITRWGIDPCSLRRPRLLHHPTPVKFPLLRLAIRRRRRDPSPTEQVSGIRRIDKTFRRGRRVVQVAPSQIE